LSLLYKISVVDSDEKRSQRTFERRQFPITAAYAFTDYRSQGQTITCAFVDIRPREACRFSICMWRCQEVLDKIQYGFFLLWPGSRQFTLPNTRGWTLPDRDLDLLASIDLLSRDTKNLQFTLNVLYWSRATFASVSVKLIQNNSSKETDKHFVVDSSVDTLTQDIEGSPL